MALRDQPYIPLYVQDYLTDENLALCSWHSQGIYIKIICVFHKQQEYGSILFKQKSKQSSKQNESTVPEFASILIRLIPCQLEEMISALDELISNDVLKISGNKLYQNRMVKDGKISEQRSKAAKKGGGNPNLFKQKSKQSSKQTIKQNPEYEYEYENIYKDNKKKKNENFEIFESENILIACSDNLSEAESKTRISLIKKELLKPGLFLNNIQSVNEITSEQAITITEKFIDHISATGEFTNSLKEIKHHAANWIKLNHSRELKENNKSNKRKFRNDSVEKYSDKLS